MTPNFRGSEPQLRHKAGLFVGALAPEVTLSRVRIVTSIAVGFLLALFGLSAPSLRAQVQKPLLLIEEDCQSFAIAPNGKIAFAVRRIKGVKKLILERDDIWVSDPDGKRKRILEGDKWIPYTEKMSYSIQSLRWSPDSQRLIAQLEMQSMGADPNATPLGGRSILLLDENGSIVTVASNEPKPVPAAAPNAPAKPSGFSSSDDNDSSAAAKPAARPGVVEGVSDATWLNDGKTIAFLSGAGPYTISTMHPADGKKNVLFEGKTFIAVAWNGAHNQAAAISYGVRGNLTLMELDLSRETLRDLAPIPGYDSSLSISPSGKRIGFFYNGDVLEVRDLANPQKPIDVRAGAGKFEWGKDERRVLLKRGMDKRSNNLVWITLSDGNFRPFMHDILFHDFEIMPDGDTIAITEPGKRTLKIFRLE